MNEEKNIIIKVHDSYRWVVAVCDKDLLGRKLEEGNKALDLSGPFFQGEEMDEEQAKEELERCEGEDATFNIVGEKSVNLAREVGLIDDGGVMKIEGIPFALVLM